MMIPVCVAAACAASSVSAQHSSSASDATIVVNAGSQARSAPTLRYDASLGTLPTEQGWDFELGTLDGDDQVVGGVLHLNIDDGSNIVFASDAGVLDWNDGYRLSMRVRVPEGSVAGQGFRGGASLLGKDALGHVYAVLVGADEYVFSSHSNLLSHSEWTILREFDGAAAFHTYSIVSYLDGAVLEIDGVPRAYVPVGDLHDSVGTFRVQWSADSQHEPVLSQWTEVVFADVEPCIGDLNGDCIVDSADLAILLAGWGVCN